MDRITEMNEITEVLAFGTAVQVEPLPHGADR
jgi:uncharacterized protein YbjQ (UPF0145 family)